MTWIHVASIDLDEMNADVMAGEPTVDVAIYYPSNLDAPHHEKVNVELLEHGFRKAKQVFGEAEARCFPDRVARPQVLCG